MTTLHAANPSSYSDVTWEDSVHRMQVGKIGRPGIVIRWADDAMLHACLGVTGAPVEQGVDAAASGVAMRAWFSRLVAAISGHSPASSVDGVPSSEFFDRLSTAQYGAISNALHTPQINEVWGYELACAGLSTGRFFMVWAARKGRNHALQQNFTPFRGW